MKSFVVVFLSYIFLVSFVVGKMMKTDLSIIKLNINLNVTLGGIDNLGSSYNFNRQTQGAIAYGLGTNGGYRIDDDDTAVRIYI